MGMLKYIQSISISRINYKLNYVMIMSHRIFRFEKCLEDLQICMRLYVYYRLLMLLLSFSCLH